MPAYQILDHASRTTFIYDQVFLLFMPGKRGGVIGNSHDIIRQEDEEAIFERWAAENIHIVQRFDVGLEQDVLGGTATGLGESYQKHWGGETQRCF